MSEITSIESSGTQAINTGIEPDYTGKVIIDFMLLETPQTGGCIAGFMGSLNGTKSFLIFWNTDRFCFRNGSSSEQVNAIGAAALNERHIYEVRRTGEFYIDNVLQGIASVGALSPRVTPLYLFACNAQGNLQKYVSARVYSCQIYDINGVLVRDFYPWDEEGTYGLYDGVNDVFYSNIGTGTFTPGTPAIVGYSVEYDSNGGTGTMNDQSIVTDVPTALSLNTFTKEEYIFSGWATSPDGPVVYQDGQTVTNIAETGGSVTLYAVWAEAPGFDVTLQYNNSPKEQLDKDIETISTLSGTLREGSSLIDPVIIVEGSIISLRTCNYMTIGKFGRKYFVNNIRSIRQGLIEISAHVDVLTTYKAKIRENRAIIKRSQGNYNLYLNDGSLKVQQNPKISTKAFPQGFITSIEFVLAVAGGSGSNS